MGVRDRFELIQAYPGSAQSFSLPRQQQTYRLVSLTLNVTHDSNAGVRRYTLVHQTQLGGGSSITIAEFSALAGDLDDTARITYSTAEGSPYSDSHIYMRVQIPADFIIEPGESVLFAIEDGVGPGDQIENVVARVKWLERPTRPD